MHFSGAAILPSSVLEPVAIGRSQIPLHCLAIVPFKLIPNTVGERLGRARGGFASVSSPTTASNSAGLVKA
jgi:hypothetical protein